MPKKTAASRLPPTHQKRSARTRRPVAGSCLVSEQARQLVGVFFLKMGEGLQNPSYRESAEWEQLFGGKDSLAIHLHKLVSTLALLPGHAATQEAEATPKAREAEPLTKEEMGLLKAWLDER